MERINAATSPHRVMENEFGKEEEKKGEGDNAVSVGWRIFSFLKFIVFSRLVHVWVGVFFSLVEMGLFLQ